MYKNKTDFLRIQDAEYMSVVGKIDYTHTKKNQSGTAYSTDEGVSLFLHLPRVIGTSELRLILMDEGLKANLLSFSGKWMESIGNDDIYKVVIPKGKLCVGLYFFYFEINGYSSFYGFKNGNNIYFSNKKEGREAFQLTIYSPEYNAPSEKYGGIIYHIFVDRFCRGGDVKPKDDAVMIEDWGSEIVEYPSYPGAFLKNNTFYGGTLYGVASKLDYLEQLGVNTIYLSPVFDAYSNHKYDTGDYSHVDSMFGGDEALAELISKAKKRNIGVILDGVFNHTGSDSIYFNKSGKYDSTGAYQSKKSQYYSWYRFQAHPEKYTCWWGIDILPRIHPDEPSCAEYFVGTNGIIEKYAELGIDGFRLDVADELSDEFISQIKAALNRKNTSSILYGEVWEDASNKIAYDKRKKYYLGNELDGVMNYPVRTGIIEYIKFKHTDALRYALMEVFPNMPKRIRDAAMNLLGTHDTERILTVLGGEDPKEKTNAQLCKLRMTPVDYSLAIKRLCSAYTVVATLPGIPSIYYGDEAGIEGYSDPFNRRTYPWGKENLKLLDHYKAIGKIRREFDVYKCGEFKLLHLTDKLLAFERIDGNKRFITVYNNSNEAIPILFDKKTKDLLTEQTGWYFSLEPESATIFLTDSSNFIIL